jgi:hypothetical protein
MAQTPVSTHGKKRRVQVKVFDVDSGEERSSAEYIIPVNGNGGVIGGFSCCCTTSHFCIVEAATKQ